MMKITLCVYKKEKKLVIRRIPPGDPVPRTSMDLAKIPPTVHRNGNIDESVVKNMLKEDKDFITDHFEVKVGRMVTEIKRERENTSKVRARVEELSPIITTSTANIFIKKPNAPPRLKEIHKKICLLPVLFNERFMLKVLSRSLIGSFLNMIEGDESYHDLQSRGLEMLAIL